MSVAALAERPAPAPIVGDPQPKADGARSLSHAFWFGQIDLRALALFRVGFGLYILWDLIDLLPNADVWFSNSGVFPLPAMLAEARIDRFSLMDSFASSAPLVYAYLFLAMVAFACVAVGYHTRLATVIGYLFLAGLDERVNELYDGADSVIRIMLLWLCFAPSGNRYSIDALLAEERGQALSPTAMAFPVRLLQLQLGWIYLSSCLNKTLGKMWTALPVPDAAHDFESPALHYALRLSHAFAKPWAVMVADNAWAMAFGSWFTMVLEGSFLVLVFSPFLNKPLKALAIAAGFALHFGILASMNVGLFSLLMPITYLVLLEPEWVEWVIDRFATVCRRAGPSAVIYDGSCGVCARTRHRLEQMDRFRNLQFIDIRKGDLPKSVAGVLKPKAVEKRIHVLRPDGRIDAGWDGVASAFARLPSGFVLAFLMRVPLLHAVGSAVHGWVVDRRHSQWEADGAFETPRSRREPFIPAATRRQASRLLLAGEFGLFVFTTWYSGPPWMNKSYPEKIDVVVQSLSAWSSWDMFSPDPLSEDYRLAAPAEFSDGTKTDLFDEPVSYPVSHRRNFFSRWYKYMENVIGGGETLPRQWAEWQCRRHNSMDPAVKLYAFTLKKFTQVIPPIDQPWPPVDTDDIWIARCYDKPGDANADQPAKGSDDKAGDKPADDGQNAATPAPGDNS